MIFSMKILQLFLTRGRCIQVIFIEKKMFLGMKPVVLICVRQVVLLDRESMYVKDRKTNLKGLRFCGLFSHLHRFYCILLQFGIHIRAFLISHVLLHTIRNLHTLISSVDLRSQLCPDTNWPDHRGHYCCAKFSEITCCQGDSLSLE